MHVLYAVVFNVYVCIMTSTVFNLITDAIQLFALLNANGDEEILPEEFIEGC